VLNRVPPKAAIRQTWNLIPRCKTKPAFASETTSGHLLCNPCAGTAKQGGHSGQQGLAYPGESILTNCVHGFSCFEPHAEIGHVRFPTPAAILFLESFFRSRAAMT